MQTKQDADLTNGLISAISGMQRIDNYGSRAAPRYDWGCVHEESPRLAGAEKAVSPVLGYILGSAG